MFCPATQALYASHRVPSTNHPVKAPHLLHNWRSSPWSAGRLSSNFFPWGGKYKIEDLPTYEGIKEALARAGQVRYCSEGCHKIRLRSGVHLAI